MNVEIKILWNPPKLHFLGRKLNLNRKLAGGVEDKTCHLALSSFFSQLFHLGQKTGILLTLDVVHSMLLWLLVLGRVNRATEKQCVPTYGAGMQKRGWHPCLCEHLTGKQALSCQVGSVLPIQTPASLRAAQPTHQNKKNLFSFYLNLFLQKLSTSPAFLSQSREKKFSKLESFESCQLLVSAIL